MTGSPPARLSRDSAQMPMLLREAAFQPSTVDVEARTVELDWTTGAVVRRGGFFTEDFDEELSLDEEAVRLSRLNSGANLLDSHQSRGIRNVVGVTEKAWLLGPKSRRVGRAVVRFSRRDDVEPIWRDVLDGVIRNVSVGYVVHRWERVERKDKVPLMVARDWEPLELSLVSVPADAGAQVRSDERVFSCVIEGRNSKMTDRTVAAEGAADQALPEKETGVKQQVDETRAAEGEDKDKRAAETKPAETRKTDKANGDDRQAERAATPPVPQGPSEEEIRARIQREVDAELQRERDRTSAIQQAVRTLKIEPDIGERLIKEKIPTELALRTLMDEAARRDAATRIVQRPARVEPGEQDEEVVLGRSIASALLHRFNPELFPLECEGRRFITFSLVEMARHCLHSANVPTTGMVKAELADRALLPGYGVRGGSGYHTSSDFVSILADVANKTLRQAYDEAQRTFRPFARRATAPDFKNVNRMQLGELPTLAIVGEHGEYKRVTMSDAKESYALATYGNIFAVTRKVIINDDLDAFTRLPQQFGASAARTESDVVWSVITANANMHDGTPLFHANHGNLTVSSSGPPSVATVGAARAKMRVQRGLDGVLINVTPRFLIVPAALETVAEQFLSTTMVPTQQSNVVPERMRASLTLIVEPRLDADSITRWYLAAMPTDIDTIEYAYLEGQDGVEITSRTGFDIDGVEIKASLDFAAKAIDWRGLFRDDGV